ncbi:MAG: aspartate ammonia-lyase [Phycisphaerae bacterium]|nr:aspartate ammonia-lyase [Phycisphaerae bacterium]
MANNIRNEHDLLGSMEIQSDALHGIHTARAMENFPLANRPVDHQLITAFGQVKLACATTNERLGFFPDKVKAAAIIQACTELSQGFLNEYIIVDRLQGGAGTSLNMNVNEVIANRALQIMGHSPGDYSIISPTDDINLHQSTNDTFPTALKLAAIELITKLEANLVSLQESFQRKEKEFADIVRVGRTQLQDAVLTTLGRQFSAYAEAINRDRWRVYKCHERLRVINLGGTAIGTGLAAPRQYIFQVSETLRELTGIGFARADNLIDATQNADVFVEVSGILKASAASLLKISTDLRLLSSGPEAGFGEIKLPQRQAGSSIMPGKVNPVIPEAVAQVAMKVMGNDQTITIAAASGNLELNPFLPLIADCLLENCHLLSSACDIFARYCIDGIEADRQRCQSHVDSATATVTALVSELGYEKACQCVTAAKENNQTLKQYILDEKLISEQRYNELITPESICRLGH